MGRASGSNDPYDAAAETRAGGIFVAQVDRVIVARQRREGLDIGRFHLLHQRGGHAFFKIFAIILLQPASLHGSPLKRFGL